MLTELAKTFEHSIGTFRPCPPATDRTSWDGLPRELKEQLVSQGECYVNYAYPSILATDFMEFSRTGNRVNYEDKLFNRRNILDALVLAECVEYKGRFLDDILNAIFLICGETAWQLPAHNSYIRDTPQLLLPDVDRPVVDLFAAETGAVLAVAEYVLRDVLENISPAISILINRNLEKRVFTPYLNEYFWWMGDGREAVNNWTSWCTQNILLAAFTRELPGADTVPVQAGLLSSDDRTRIFGKACQSLDYFLASYGEDGCCDEGAQYYRHAGLTLFNSLVVLNGITDGGFESIYQNTKVKNIAAYILNAHVHGEYYVNFADCSPVAGRCNAREYLFGKWTDNSELMAFAAADYQNSDTPLTPDEHNLFYRLQTVFNHEDMMACDKSKPINHPDIYYSSVGLFITRDEHYYLAVKGGDNDDSHNHNDTGSFIIYKDGLPLFIDAGVESYTKKTFSPQRYEIWAMQSAYHNLPSFDGLMQKDGSCYGARNIRYALDPESGEITMELAPAYPDDNLGSYIRTARLDKRTGITITDTYSGPRKPVVLSLMTYEKPVISGDTIAIGQLGSCRIAGASGIRSECIPITDARLQLAWKHDIYRTLVTMTDSQLILSII